jgi:hypothetical protein
MTRRVLERAPGMTPNASIIAWLIETITLGWVDVVPHPPESELDPMLLGCRIARLAEVVKHPEPLWVIGALFVDGEPASGDLVELVRAWDPEHSLQIEGAFAGIEASVFVRDVDGRGTVDLECVYRGKCATGNDPSHFGFGARILAWCDAVVSLASSLGAVRVELPGRDGPEPLILAESSRSTRM